MARWFLDRTPQPGAPTINLRRLLPDAHFVGAGDSRILAYASDPRRLEAGDWFVAVPTETETETETDSRDGASLVARAIERGAAGVVVERAVPDPGRLQVVVGDVRSAQARISHALAGDPARCLPVVAVAGASGKAAVGSFLRAIRRAQGEVVGSMSSATWFDGDSIRPLGPKAPDAPRIAAMLAGMVHHGCDCAVLEVDHRAIQARDLDGVPLAVAVVTNLGDDDCRADRRRAYARLIRRVEAGGSVIIDADDPEADVLGAVNLAARRVTFGVDDQGDCPSRTTLSAVVDRTDAGSCRFLLRGFDREMVVTLRVGGGLATVRQAMAAAAVAWSQGVPADAVVRGLESVARIPGRFEAVRAGQPFEVRVDQGRTAADLTRALAHLRALAPGRIVCVVGAEGAGVGVPGSYLRDAERAGLGRAVEAGADLVVLTTDNPRNEDPNAVVEEIRAGMIHPGRVRVELDRRAAIAFALAHAQPGDGVLIAGKGAHTFQVVGSRVTPFDDAAEADQILRADRPGATRASA